jgi:hypothetical protein
MKLGDPMAKSPFEVFGLPEAFVRTHSKEVVIATVTAILMSYHPDKTKHSGVVLPKGMSFSDFSDARDAIKDNFEECVKAISGTTRTTRDRNEVIQLKNRSRIISELHTDEAKRNDAMWLLYASQKLKVVRSVVAISDTQSGYHSFNLNGVAIMVSIPNTEFWMEYSCSEDFWFKRKLRKKSFGAKTPFPPSVEKSLVTYDTGSKTSGHYFDQVEMPERMDVFSVIGSYIRSQKTEFRKLAEAKTVTPPSNTFAKELLTITGQQAETQNVDSDVFRVLSPYIIVGSTMVCADLDVKYNVRYFEVGNISRIRVFDSSQRPR